MLKKILHRIVAIPFVYDLLQTAVGARVIRKRLQKRLANVHKGALVVDIGGGTGLNRILFDDHVRYVCLDNDSVKLHGFLQKAVAGSPILGDAGNMPFPTGGGDVVICTAVIYHLPDEVLSAFVQEAFRILNPNGQFVVFDPVWAPKRMAGRLLWKYDRGSFPRTPETLRTALSKNGQVVHWENFAIFHRYVIGI
ncbi:MAG TPA: class I SAM-dependent methyltransferase, partial [Aggregatilineales bacterium]|nr:class I SAM-dependent methyltransferase [Aggregatilineales bacterium]